MSNDEKIEEKIFCPESMTVHYNYKLLYYWNCKLCGRFCLNQKAAQDHLTNCPKLKVDARKNKRKHQKALKAAKAPKTK